MIFYKAAGLLVGTQADAKAIDRAFVQVDVPTDKAGLMSYINDLLSQIAAASNEPPANAEAAPQTVTASPAPPITRVEPNYTERSIKIDEMFEELPLGKQLHLACLALENARSRLK